MTRTCFMVVFTNTMWLCCLLLLLLLLCTPSTVRGKDVRKELAKAQQEIATLRQTLVVSDSVEKMDQVQQVLNKHQQQVSLRGGLSTNKNNNYVEYDNNDRMDVYRQYLEQKALVRSITSPEERQNILDNLKRTRFLQQPPPKEPPRNDPNAPQPNPRPVDPGQDPKKAERDQQREDRRDGPPQPLDKNNTRDYDPGALPRQPPPGSDIKKAKRDQERDDRRNSVGPPQPLDDTNDRNTTNSRLLGVDNNGNASPQSVDDATKQDQVLELLKRREELRRLRNEMRLEGAGDGPPQHLPAQHLPAQHLPAAAGTREQRLKELKERVRQRRGQRQDKIDLPHQPQEPKPVEARPQVQLQQQEARSVQEQPEPAAASGAQKTTETKPEQSSSSSSFVVDETLFQNETLLKTLQDNWDLIMVAVLGVFVVFGHKLPDVYKKLFTRNKTRHTL